MGTGPKVALGLVGVVLVLVLSVPILAGLAGGWTEAKLVGTKWRSEQDGVEVVVTFKEGGRMGIEVPNLSAMIEAQMAQVPPEQAAAIRPLIEQELQRGLPDGNWRLTEDKIYIRGPRGVPGADQEQIITIEGNDLLLEGQKLDQVE